MKSYAVTLPIAGHVSFTVMAENEKDAVKKALEMELPDDHSLSWETLEQFQEGNVCYCPSPWEAEAVLEHEEDEA